VRWPDIQFHFLPAAVSYDGTTRAREPGFQVHVGPMLSPSRGEVRLRSADPDDKPIIRFNYMSCDEDWQVFRAALHLAREIFDQRPLDAYRGKELAPGSGVNDDSAIDAFVRQHAESAYHPCGTCRMGTGEGAVVDNECRVHGIEGLRVIDASVFPHITNGNLNAPTIMLGMAPREWVAVLVIGSFVVGTATNLDIASDVFIAARDYVVATFDWFFTGVASCALLAAIWIGVDPRFNVRLGEDHERPEFTNLAWFAMLFSAGLASGVLYWATAEPILHFQGNPHLAMEGAVPLSPQAAQTAVTLTIFHWGLHGWGFYVLTGLGIAYFAFRRGLPLALRSALYPVLGEHIHRWPGLLVDLIGVMGTVFGVATSIGLAVAGMNAAMNQLFGIAINITNQLAIVGLVSALGVMSVISGVSRGIRRLSELNVYLSAGLSARFCGFVNWRLRGSRHSHGFLDRRLAAGPGLAERMDGLLLGMVARVGTFRRVIHCARIPRAHRARIRCWRNDGSHAERHHLDVDFRGRRDAWRVVRYHEHHRSGERGLLGGNGIGDRPARRSRAVPGGSGRVPVVHLADHVDRFRHAGDLHITEARPTGYLRRAEDAVGPSDRRGHRSTAVRGWGNRSAGGLHRFRPPDRFRDRGYRPGHIQNHGSIGCLTGVRWYDRDTTNRKGHGSCEPKRMTLTRNKTKRLARPAI
jgi:hypothetical protein